jgi:hypothetical protein
VQKSIDSLQLKSSAWNNKHDKDLENLGKAILHLEGVDIEQEIAAHQNLKAWEELDKKIRALSKQRSTLESAVIQAQKTRDKYAKEVESLKDKTCPACEQELHDHKHETMTADAVQHLAEAQTYFNKVSDDLKKVLEDIMSPAFGRYIKHIDIIAPKPTTFKITLINDQDFNVKYLGKNKFNVKVSGRQYHPDDLGESERCSQSIANLLELNYVQTEGKEADGSATPPPSSGGDFSGGATPEPAPTGPGEEEFGADLAAANAEPTPPPAEETPPPAEA